LSVHGLTGRSESGDGALNNGNHTWLGFLVSKRFFYPLGGDEDISVLGVPLDEVRVLTASDEYSFHDFTDELRFDNFVLLLGSGKMAPRDKEVIPLATTEEEYEIIKAKLIGKVVKGVLIRRRQNAYFIKWHPKYRDVFISAKRVEESLGDKKAQPGMVAVVKCTITGFGPSSQPMDRQNPCTTSIEIVTRYPGKNYKKPEPRVERTRPTFTNSRREQGCTWRAATPRRRSDSPSASPRFARF
jgi:hypothetical protein